MLKQLVAPVTAGAFLALIASAGLAAAAAPYGAPSDRTIERINPHPRNLQAVPNVFEAARGRYLTYSDLGKYIDPSVTGADREMARHLMALMPINQRGDFIYVSRNGRLLSNNPARLRYVTLTYRRATPQNRKMGVSPVLGRGWNEGPNPDDYQSPCSPPNPPSNPHGAYVRNVSQCGFAAGWAFVNLPCGTTVMNDGDQGYLYWELRGNAGSLVEGGLNYYSDHPSGVPPTGGQAPYLRSSAIGNGGYETLTNGSARYDCGQNMGIFHGAALPSAGQLTFTEVGIVPSNLDPQTEWLNSQIVTLENAAWLFGPAPSDVTGDSIDNAGFETACGGCSISQVTSIAQNANNYNSDGSFFGVSVGQNAINWLQVGMGDWGGDCYPGSTLCTFYVAADPTGYYGGPQYYPDSNISQSNFFLAGYGPYETFDGILLPGGSPITQRTALGGFNEPLPPLPCTLDSQNFCSVATINKIMRTAECTNNQGQNVSVTQILDTWWETYSVRTIQQPVDYETQTYSVVQRGCQRRLISTVWTPGEPKVLYNDPNLP